MSLSHLVAYFFATEQIPCGVGSNIEVPPDGTLLQIIFMQDLVSNVMVLFKYCGLNLPKRPITSHNPHAAHSCFCVKICNAPLTLVYTFEMPETRTLYWKPFVGGSCHPLNVG